MQKVDGVQNVRVSLNDGLTILDLKPGNTVTLVKLRQIIKSNGFVSKDATVLARGSVKKPQSFVVAGTSEELRASAAPRQAGESWQLTVPATR